MTINNLGQIISARGGQASTQRAATAVVSVANGLGRLGCGALADKIVQRGRPRAVLLVAADLMGRWPCFCSLFLGPRCRWH